jgi:hypothetical protein
MFVVSTDSNSFSCFPDQVISHRLWKSREILTAVNTKIVFRDLTSCSLLELYERFGVTCFLHRSVRGESSFTLKMESVGYSEMFVTLYYITRFHVRENSNFRSLACSQGPPLLCMLSQMKAVHVFTTSFNIRLNVILPATAKCVKSSVSILILDRTKEYIVIFVHLDIKEMEG